MFTFSTFSTFSAFIVAALLSNVSQGRVISSSAYLSWSDKQGIVNLHNSARQQAARDYGSYGYSYKAMSYSTRLANEALVVANWMGEECTMKHTDDEFYAKYGEYEYETRGECIGGSDWETAINSMLEEKSLFTWRKYAAYIWHGGERKALGHYMQIIQQSTRQVGCAKVTCTSGRSAGSISIGGTTHSLGASTPTYVICKYYHGPYGEYPNYDPSSDWPNRPELLPDSSSSSGSSTWTSSWPSTGSTGSTSSSSGNTIWLGSSSSWGSGNTWSSSAPVAPLPFFDHLIVFAVAALLINAVILFVLCAQKCRANGKRKALQMEMEMEFAQTA